MSPNPNLHTYPMHASAHLNHDPPPQIFGSYAADGSPILTGLEGMGLTSGMFGDAGTLLDDSNEAKRRRIARACDMCRKKKIKCDGQMPACSHCTNYKTECVFTQVEKKRSPPKGAKYIEGLENRLGRMENLLRLSGLLNEDDGGSTDLGMLEKRLASRESSKRDASHFSDSIPTSPVAGDDAEGDAGRGGYIGSSSGFSIFSPKGIQWVNEKTGDQSFQTMIAEATVDDNKWVYWKPEVFGDIFERRIYLQLPQKAEALSLLKDFFENFNCMFPLFHQPTFMHLDGGRVGRVALAVEHRLRVMSNLVPEEEDQKAWGYLKNAMAVYTELTMRNTDLLSVQALLGMALFMQGTPNPQPSFLLVASAIRLSHSIGLHKRGSGFNLNPIEIEQRKRVFWIGYMLDKDICLRFGRPPVQDDDDMNVELPSADPEDNIGNIPLADGKGKVNLFRLMCEFSTIVSKVYTQLYSTRASKQSDGELLNTIGELDQQLEEWKDSIPIDFRPEHEIKASHTPLILHVVVLHFGYYNCLTTIHRMSIHHGYWTSRLSNFAIQGLNSRPLNPRVFSSAALCVSSARASIHLVKYVPQGDFSCVWLILYYPVSALMTLFGNILQNPQDPPAAPTSACSPRVKRMLGVCAEFERGARVVLDKADRDTTTRRKRKELDEVLPNLSVNRPPIARPPPSSSAGETPPQFRYGDDLSWMSDAGFHEIATDFEHLSNAAAAAAAAANGGGGGGVPFPDMSRYLSGADPHSPINPQSFQQPFVPPDLWNMPMTLEWDWADLTG
ncbi:hypothetical protein VE04_09487, partial [Pseudogymnoascus sp. 24MN13]